MKSHNPDQNGFSDSTMDKKHFALFFKIDLLKQKINNVRSNKKI